MATGQIRAKEATWIGVVSVEERERERERERDSDTDEWTQASGRSKFTLEWSTETCEGRSTGVEVAEVYTYEKEVGKDGERKKRQRKKESWRTRKLKMTRQWIR
jgi:hypothetical protein